MRFQFCPNHRKRHFTDHKYNMGSAKVGFLPFWRVTKERILRYVSVAVKPLYRHSFTRRHCSIQTALDLVLPLTGCVI